MGANRSAGIVRRVLSNLGRPGVGLSEEEPWILQALVLEAQEAQVSRHCFYPGLTRLPGAPST